MEQIKQHLSRYDGGMTKFVGITAATAIVLYSSYKLVSLSNEKGKQNNNSTKKIPTPKGGYPYSGHLLSFGADPGKQVQKWHEEVGHIFQIQMGVQSWIFLDDPVLAHKIFTTNGAQTSHRPEFNFAINCYSMNGKGVAFVQPTKSWQKARSAVISVIAPKNIDNHFAGTIKNEAIALARSLMDSTASSKDGVDPYKYFHLYSMNIIFSSAFNKTFKRVDDPEFAELSDCINEQVTLGSLENDLASFFPIFSILDYFTGKHAYTKNFYDKRRNPMFRALMKEAINKEGDNLAKSLREFDLTEDERLVLLSDLIAGGTDTVSISIYYLFAIICNYPSIQKRAAEELDNFIQTNGRTPLFTERDQFPYINSIFKESMRFRPITPFGVPHRANKDILLDGYHIPKGTVLLSSMNSMHMNSDVYSEPKSFIPERFADNQKTMLAAANGKPEERDVYNFGWGRRICPGIYLSEAEFFNAFVEVIARCIVEPTRDADGKKVYPDIDTAILAGMVLVPPPYKVNFVPRTNALI